MEEPKEHEKTHHATHENHKKMKIGKLMIWKGLTAILVLLLVVSIYTGGFNRNSNGNTADLNGAQRNQIANNAVDFLNKNVLAAQQATATLNSVSEENGLIKLDMTVQGQAYESYLTIDGKLLFPQGIDLSQNIPSQPSQPTQQDQQPTQQQNPVVSDMASLIDDDDIEGDPNAPVTIIEWSDYECPFCARFYSQTLGKIREEYIDTGKVKLVYRDFPLSFHAQAQKAAEAAECAGEQDKYYEMHNLLFEKGVQGGVSAFKQYASEIGLDTNKFNECLDSGQMADEIAKDMQDGQAIGITGTPGFIINGQLVSGAQPFENFKAIIDAKLAEIE